jgi:hypothetical protein
MKLKPDWLETLSTAARRAPLELPEPLPRTEARVLAALRGQDGPWWNYLALRGAVAACVLAVAVWMLRDEPMQTGNDASGLAAAMLSTELQP